MGPWAHGDWGRKDGDKLGDINFHAKTAEFYREKIELPFFRHFLKGDTNYTATEALRVRDRHEPVAALRCVAADAAVRAQRFISAPGGKLDFRAARAKARRLRRIRERSGQAGAVHAGSDDRLSARRYPVHDQRFAASRPDVLVYETEPLEEDLTFAGPLKATLHVSTTGTDADWVVKLIDVYAGDFPNPNPNPAHVAMGGYQQLVRGDVIRGKIPQQLREARAVRAGQGDEDRVHDARRLPHLPPRPPRDGAGAKLVVSARGPQPADLREHPDGEAGGFPQGDATRLSHGQRRVGADGASAARGREVTGLPSSGLLECCGWTQLSLIDIDRG